MFIMLMSPAPAPVRDLVRIAAVLLDVAPEVVEYVLIVVDALARPCRDTRVARRRQPDRLRHQAEAISVVAHVHVERRRGRALLLVAVDVEPARMLPAEEQLPRRR